MGRPMRDGKSQFMANSKVLTGRGGDLGGLVEIVPPDGRNHPIDDLNVQIDDLNIPLDDLDIVIDDLNVEIDKRDVQPGDRNVPALSG